MSSYGARTWTRLRPIWIPGTQKRPAMPLPPVKSTLSILTQFLTKFSGRARVAIYVALGAATLSPLLWASVPPLVDYPNHLARMWILVHRKEIPELARDYMVHWRVLPDLAMDFVIPALSMAMPVELAGRVFIALDNVGSDRRDGDTAPGAAGAV